ncbi:MAG: type III toxin-antitoxin system ToxN/AbiQ family toxin [Bariatricus sp.]
MKQPRLNLYRIDMKYIRNLHNIDNKVSSVSPQIGKHHRIYVGIVVICNDKKYLIPLSHPVEKHKKMIPKADFDKIINKNGKLLGVLNYNLMIPVEESQLIKVDLKNKKSDTPKDKQYKQLCIDELNWCRKHADIITNKANCLYNLCTEDSNYKGKTRCLNFKRLETECQKYNKAVTSQPRPPVPSMPGP